MINEIINSIRKFFCWPFCIDTSFDLIRHRPQYELSLPLGAVYATHSIQNAFDVTKLKDLRSDSLLNKDLRIGRLDDAIGNLWLGNDPVIRSMIGSTMPSLPSNVNPTVRFEEDLVQMVRAIR